MGKKHPQRKNTAAVVITVIEAVLFLGVALAMGISAAIGAAAEKSWLDLDWLKPMEDRNTVLTTTPVAPVETLAPEEQQPVKLTPTPKPMLKPTPEPTEQDVEESVVLEAIDEAQAIYEIYDMGRGYYISPVAWSQTSVVEQDGKHDNTAYAVMDCDLDTSWQEGVDGYGYGEGVYLYLDDVEYVQYLALYLGNWRSDEWYQKNNVPAELLIEYYDWGLEEYQSVSATFSYDMTAHWLKFSRPVPTDEISLFILDAYSGSMYDDTCIAEVEIYGTYDLFNGD